MMPQARGLFAGMDGCGETSRSASRPQTDGLSGSQCILWPAWEGSSHEVVCILGKIKNYFCLGRQKLNPDILRVCVMPLREETRKKL